MQVGHAHASDGVDAVTGREDLARDRAPGIEKVQVDRRSGPCNAVDSRVAFVGHLAARRAHRDLDTRTGVDVEDRRRRRALRRFDQPLLDGERQHARQHVAAVGPGVHRTLTDAHLCEQIVEITARLG